MEIEIAVPKEFAESSPGKYEITAEGIISRPIIPFHFDIDIYGYVKMFYYTEELLKNGCHIIFIVDPAYISSHTDRIFRHMTQDSNVNFMEYVRLLGFDEWENHLQPVIPRTSNVPKEPDMLLGGYSMIPENNITRVIVPKGVLYDRLCNIIENAPLNVRKRITGINDIADDISDENSPILATEYVLKR